MKSIQPGANYNDQLNYKLLTENLLRFMQLFGSFTVNLKTLKITKTLLIFNFLTLFVSIYHMYISPEVFLKIKCKLQEFNYEGSTYQFILGVLFPLVVDATAILSKITVYRMSIFLNTFYNYLYLSDMYINFNKTLENNKNLDKNNNSTFNEEVRRNWWYTNDTKPNNTWNKKGNVSNFNKSITDDTNNRPSSSSRIDIRSDSVVICLFKDHYNKICNYVIVIFICLVLPVNIMRVYELLINTSVNIGETCFIVFMYWENYFIGSIELQFVIICYSIYLRYFEINIMLENVLENHHKPMLELLAGGEIKVRIVNDIVIDNLGKL